MSTVSVCVGVDKYSVSVGVGGDYSVRVCVGVGRWSECVEW